MSDTWWGPIVALLLAAAALALAARRRVRRRRRLRDGLRSHDPLDRMEALAEVERDGVAAHADLLLDHVGSESDAAVIAEVARLVRRCRWEPIVGPAQADLRRWLAELDQRREQPRVLGGTALEELDVALAERAHLVVVTTATERLTIVRAEVDPDPGAGRNRGWR